MSLIYADGIVESRSRFCGIFLGGGDGFLFGAHRGKSQSRLSAMIGPPKKLPYAAPATLWLLGLLILMASDGRGKLSWLLEMISAIYILAISAYFLVALFHNLLVRPKKHKDWERKSICQRCGALIEALTVIHRPSEFGIESAAVKGRGREVGQNDGMAPLGLFARKFTFISMMQAVILSSEPHGIVSCAYTLHSALTLQNRGA